MSERPVRNTSCPRCGAAHANDGWARACYNCGLSFDAPTLDEDSRATLAGLLKAGAVQRTVPSVRAASADLAAALHAAGRDAEAAELLAQALAEPGPQPPPAELHRAQAEVQVALGNLQQAQRDALLWAGSDAGLGPQVIDIIRDSLVRASAEELIEWVTATWLPRLQDAGAAPRVHGLVLAAAGQALLGHGTAATDLLRAAHDIDAADATQAWSAWLEVSAAALAAVPGGEAYALSLRARGAAALADFEQARTLADQVIDGALTADGYPELEAFWLRAELPGRTDTQRADDLIAVAQRYRWRATAADLRRSVELCERAMTYTPSSATPYWHKAEALRLQASPEGAATTDPALVDAALDTWRRGAELEPPTQSWPLLIGSLVHRDCAQGHPASARSLEALCLGLAVRCVFAAPAELAGWSMVATECRRLRLWPAARWAVARSVDRVTAWTPDNGFEAFNVFLAWLDTDPAGLQDYLPKLLDAFTAMPPVRNFVEVGTRWAVTPSSPSARDEVVEALAGLSTDVARYAFEVTSSVAVGEHERAAKAAVEMEDAARTDPIAALENLRERTAALQLVGDERWRALRAQLDDRQLAAAAQGAEIDLRAAVEAGDKDATDRALELVLTSYNPGDIALNRLEFPALAQRLAADGRPAAADLARACLARFEEAAAQWVGGDGWTAAAVLADLARRAGVDDLPEILAAITAVTGLVAEHDRESGIADAAAAIAVPIALDISIDLVPVDAHDKWAEWTLFRDLIPAARAHVQEQLGMYCPGIKVREYEAPERSYRVLLDGRVVAQGTVTAAVPPARVTMAEWPDAAAWQEAIDALGVAVVAHRGELFAPATLRWMLDDVPGDDVPADDVPAEDVPADDVPAVVWSSTDVVRVWRALRADLDAGVTLPTGEVLRTRASALLAEPAEPAVTA